MPFVKGQYAMNPAVARKKAQDAEVDEALDGAMEEGQEDDPQLAAREEAEHRDLDGDGEAGESPEHKAKVLGKPSPKPKPSPKGKPKPGKGKSKKPFEVFPKGKK